MRLICGIHRNLTRLRQSRSIPGIQGRHCVFDGTGVSFFASDIKLRLLYVAGKYLVRLPQPSYA